MTKPGITELDKYVDSRYTLVSMVAKRARMIGADRRMNETVETAIKNAALDKPVTQAVNEITTGMVGYIRSEAVEKAHQYEQEKIEAISQLDAEASASSVEE